MYTNDSKHLKIYAGHLAGESTPEEEIWSKEIDLAEKLLIITIFVGIPLYTITNEFNLLPKTSKFKRYNNIISLMISQQNLQQIKEAVQILGDTGYFIENPDMFVYNLGTCFFAEVKKQKDVLREPQMRFMYLAQSILGIDSKLIYLSDSENTQSLKKIEVKFNLPNIN